MKPSIPLLLLVSVIGLALPQNSSAQIILIDFGNPSNQMASPTGGNYWNNVPVPAAGLAAGYTMSLVTTGSAASGITLTTNTAFAQNTAGTGAPTITSAPALNYANLSIDSAFVGDADTDPFTGGRFTLTGLSSGYTYQFTMFASRMGTPVLNRTADYTLVGSTTQTVQLDAQSNTSNTVSTGQIAPNSGTITFYLSSATTNTSTFAYLGGLQIVATAVPEPSTMAFLALGGVGLFLSPRRRSKGHA